MSAATASVPTEFWSSPKTEQLFPWIQRVNAAANPPHVHSVSCEFDPNPGSALPY
jgi:hypothetical protein